MSKWTHQLCDTCHSIMEPDREPVRVIDDGTQKCCRCSQTNSSGIYYRAHPDAFPCHGVTQIHA